MNATDPIAIDAHTHVEASCWNPFGSRMEFAAPFHRVGFSG